MTRDEESDEPRRRPIEDLDAGFLPPIYFVALIVGLVLAIVATFL